MSAAAASRRRIAYWTVSIVGVGMIVVFRATHEYGADSPLGVAFGMTTCALIAILAFMGFSGKRKYFLSNFAREVHKPLGVLTLGVAMAHWHLRARDYLGISTAILLLIVILALHKNSFRRFRILRKVHQYGGYGLIALALIHGMRALFFAGD